MYAPQTTFHTSECQNQFTPGKAMTTAKTILQIVSSKFNKLSLPLFLTAAALLNAPALDAGGWGTTKEIVESENISWQKVFFDMNDLYFTALLPDYQSGQLKNGLVSLYGLVDDSGYLITTGFNPGFTPPSTIKKFVKMVKDANPEFIVTQVDVANLRAKYAVDLIPVNQEDSIFWRFLSTEDRLIKMGTEDSNEIRRRVFFDSILIK
ncbi:MAG: hypothetical protein H0W50_11210 [Parachlamydiaceae bacterium]|nr:hypothetical protein [Parachlamydiaceae bacterium]